MPGPNRPPNYYDTLTAALNDMATYGFDSAERIEYWTARLREAAERQMGTVEAMDAQMREAMAAVYKRLVDSGGLLKLHPGVDRFTLEKLRPQLHSELQRRIFASADLIKLNRQEAVSKTIRRFQGWATSVPKGGTDNIKKQKVKQDVRKSLTSLPFEERRVLIDQGHKLSASLSEVVATDNGALGGVWRSHFRQPGYDYRPDHKERDGKFYLMRSSWAQAAGLVKPGPAGYYDDITAVAEEPFCRCWMVWAYNLRQVPPECLTKKGEAKLAEARAAVAAMAR